MANAEEYREGWCRADRLLRKLYNELGPKEVHNQKFRAVPTRKFAALTRKQIEAWDGMSDECRTLMWRIARHLES